MNKINLRSALEFMDYDEEILYSVVDAFIKEVPGLVKQLDDAILADDRATAERAAHTLKGNFLILQLHDQQSEWARIEAAIHDNGISNIAEFLLSARAVSDDVVSQLRDIMDARKS